MEDSTYGFNRTDASLLVNMITGIETERSEFTPSSGSSIRYFVLAEDANECPVYAFRASMSDSGEITPNDPPDRFLLYFHSDLLRLPKMARAGYRGIYGIDDEGRETFLANACINSCEGDGAFAPNLPDGTVGEPYTGSAGGSNIDGDVSAIGLPPGLSINAGTGAITGTPTEAGIFIVTFTGTDTAGCAVTDIDEITIATGDGGGGGPDPEPPVGGD